MDKNNKEKKKWYELGFFYKLFHDKFYLLSLLVTLIFLAIISINALKKSEGWISRQKRYAKMADKVKNISGVDAIKKVDNGTTTNNGQINSVVLNGFYSHRYSLKRAVTINNCNVKEYQYIYEIDNDVTNKYFYNQCLGYKKIDTSIISFQNDTIVENGTIYKEVNDMNIGISVIDNVYFYGNNFIVLKDDNLLLISGSDVLSNNDLYPNNGNSDIKRYYKSGEYKYRFIVFNKDLPLCPFINNSEDVLYTIYEIEYDKDSKSMKNPSVIIERYSKDFCDNYDKDIEVLKQ